MDGKGATALLAGLRRGGGCRRHGCDVGRRRCDVFGAQRFIDSVEDKLEGDRAVDFGAVDEERGGGVHAQRRGQFYGGVDGLGVL